MQRKLLVTVLVVANLLLLNGHPRAANAPLDKVRIGLDGPITNLDPARAQDRSSRQIASLITGQLFRFDARHQPQPDLVDSYRVSDDGLTYTMTLHRDLKYSDGSPLVIDDIIASWNRIKDSETPDRGLIGLVATVEAADSSTIVWRLSSPEPDFLQFLGLLQIHPKVKIESDNAYYHHPISAGPYYLKDWTPGASSALLVENPNYVHGPLSIQQIEVVSAPDITARTLQLVQDNLDFVFDASPSVRDAGTKDVKVSPHSLGGMAYLALNMAVPRDWPLADRNVREAISLAIDREAIGRLAFSGVSIPATGFLYSSAGALRLQNFPNGGKRDLAAAKALLAKTPFKDGFQFGLGVLDTQPGWKAAAQVIHDNLSDLGINARIDLLNDLLTAQKLANGDYDAIFGEDVAYPPVAFLDNLLMPGSTWAHWTRYSSADMSKLLQAARDLDPKKRADAFGSIQDLAYKDMPYIVLSESAVLNASRIPGDVLVASDPGDYLVVKTLADR